MENLNEWKIRDEILVSKIKEFCDEYKKKHIQEFSENEYSACQKMFAASGKKFKKEIESQVFGLVRLRQNSLFS